MVSGASFITIPTNLNITSLRLSQHESMNVFRGAVDLCQTDGKDDGEERDLENIVPRRRVEKALRHDVLDDAGEGDARLGERRSRLEGGSAELYSDAGFHDVHGDQPDYERKRRRDLEVDHRPERQLPDTLEIITVPRDPDNEGCEQQPRHRRSLR
jgi:hypothetical protein